MSSSLVCWKCGASIEGLPQPLSRFSECDACRADLHVCRQCVFYDTSKAKHCQEPIAEEEKNKTRANFCDYFKVRLDAFTAADTQAVEAARTELEALFGVGGAKPGGVDAKPQTDADRARAELEALFGSKGGSSK